MANKTEQASKFGIGTVATGAETFAGVALTPLKAYFHGIPAAIDQVKTIAASVQDKPDQQSSSLAHRLVNWAQVDTAYDLDQKNSDLSSHILTGNEATLVSNIRKARDAQNAVLLNPPVRADGKKSPVLTPTVLENMYIAANNAPLTPQQDVAMQLGPTGQAAIHEAAVLDDSQNIQLAPRKVLNLSDDIRTDRMSLRGALDRTIEGTNQTRREAVLQGLRNAAREQGGEAVLAQVQQRLDGYYSEISRDLNARLSADHKEFTKTLGYTLRNMVILGLGAEAGTIIPAINGPVSAFLQNAIGEHIDVAGIINTLASFVGVDTSISSNVASHNWILILGGVLTAGALAMGIADSGATMIANLVQQSKLRWRLSGDKRESKREMKALRQSYIEDGIIPRPTRLRDLPGTWVNNLRRSA
ncbi:MAG TPA: hypothetical protein VFQ63_00690 [Patescibacteria group bacterium]|nr:hypothetical protein [Patescibacteria group bacterium]